MVAPAFKLLRLRRFPILWQLQLEQALHRVDKSSWLLINDGTPDPAIVMGISGKLQQMVHADEAKAAGISVIKRFSGGGTVAVDTDTVFATLISDEATLPEVKAYARPIMEYTEGLYRHAFGSFGNFRLRENDYCFGDAKFGGNAQAITKQRWLHHTSFLWDFRQEHIQLLKHPERQPEYRNGRDHLDFICRLKDVMPSRQTLLDALPNALQAAGYTLEEATLEQAEEALATEHFKSNKVIDL